MQEGLQEGRAIEARAIILRQGRVRFGVVDDAIKAMLEAITDQARLVSLVERLPDASSWEDLLGDS